MLNAPMPSVLPVYKRAPVTFERGEGAYLFDREGRRYLDFCSGIAVTLLGHGHPHLVGALKAQAERLWHCSNLYGIEGQEQLADRLVAHSFADTVFFCNSGAEALECAIKMTRRFHHERGQPERHKIITFSGAFHGRTMATISAGGQAKYLEGFAPALPGFQQVEPGDLKAVEAAIDPETAGLLIEPVQGEGGLRALDVSYLEGLRKLCEQNDLLMIFDEVADWARPYRQAVCLRMEWHRPRSDGACQGACRRLSHGCLPCNREGRERDGARHPRLDFRRQSAGFRRRQCRGLT